ncbi:hypothetical protein ACE1AT_04140 [Pelatocladus sp. BLCC-F211]|uniref:hypothetical protein n=1 Tax=Pelatocladus sp. BLCC-F211 TaxID=3342752 RepID=UPI0035BAC2AE
MTLVFRLRVWVGDVAKKLFLAELETQFRNTVLYPPQNCHLSMSQIILEQARSLGRCLLELSFVKTRVWKSTGI